MADSATIPLKRPVGQPAPAASPAATTDRNMAYAAQPIKFGAPPGEVAVQVRPVPDNVAAPGADAYCTVEIPISVKETHVKLMDKELKMPVLRLKYNKNWQGAHWSSARLQKALEAKTVSALLGKATLELRNHDQTPMRVVIDGVGLTPLKKSFATNTRAVSEVLFEKDYSTDTAALTLAMEHAGSLATLHTTYERSELTGFANVKVGSLYANYYQRRGPDLGLAAGSVSTTGEYMHIPLTAFNRVEADTNEFLDGNMRLVDFEKLALHVMPFERFDASGQKLESSFISDRFVNSIPMEKREATFDGKLTLDLLVFEKK